MNRIVEVLCRRDGISVREATSIVRHVQDLIEHSNMGFDEVETIMAEELGLEVDYVFDLLEV